MVYMATSCKLFAGNYLRVQYTLSYVYIVMCVTFASDGLKVK